MRTWIALGTALLLGGCGLPPALTIASYALDGLSFLSTGKSVSDHAISVAANQDCAVWRLIKDEAVCRDFETDDTGGTVLVAEQWRDEAEIVGMAQPGAVAGRRPDAARRVLAVAEPVVLPQFAGARPGAGLAVSLPPGPVDDPFVAIENAPDGGQIADRATGEPWTLPAGMAPIEPIGRARAATAMHRQPGVPALADASMARHGRVLVLGSFARLDNAKRVARRFATLHPAIVRTRLDGGMFHRVIVGASGDDFDRRRQQLASAGQVAWAADVCANGAIDAGCIALPGVFSRSF